MRHTLSALLALSLCAAGRAQDPSKSDLPLRLRLVNKGETYKAPADLKKVLADAKTSGNYPEALAVNLVLEVTNHSDKAVEFYVSGTPVTYDLQLKGPGAVSGRPRIAFPKIYILPRPVTLAPGKTHKIPITRLQYGLRNMAERAYWTEPGEYTLVARFNTSIKPAPKGAKVVDKNGFGRVTLVSEPLKIKVEK